MKRKKTQPVRTPSATYRLQFSHLFPFQAAKDVVAYLDDLGVTDVYASPFLMAPPKSVNGYDITDHSRFNPEIGDEESFLAFSAALQRCGMGLVADIVPNHMCVTHPSNEWWWDVLANGPSSPYSRYFDIDWRPPKEELTNKVLLPVLGDQFGRVLENQEIQVVYSQGQFHVAFHDTPLPLAPRSLTMILEPALGRLRDKLDASHEHLAELESIITSLRHLPNRWETGESQIHERRREKDIIRRRMSQLVEASPQAREAIESALTEINGRRDDPHSFDRLERLLDSQAYRLSFWRVAMDEVNYRRFFDINDLAAIRPEDPEVFAAVHALIFDLVKRGHVTGLRVDHPDGLYEPEKYFQYLQDACKAQTSRPVTNGNGAHRTFYVVAEKILTGSEPLRTSWAIEGSTGYDFLNLLNGLFIDRGKEKAFHQIYRRFTGWSERFSDLVIDSKRLILQLAMSGELNVLARRLDRISEQHRWSRDFTLQSLKDALREMIAAFPVYRTYSRSEDKEMTLEDRRQIVAATNEAKKRNPAISESVFDFIQSVLLLENPEGLDEAHCAEQRTFVMRFQQLTAPVMAKGVEDTAFYRYFPMTSLNEVGGSPEQFGVSVSKFHRSNATRGVNWPNGMNATSTHDCKRGEDVRARINVLSEMPREWHRAIRRWSDMNRSLKSKIKGTAVPDANEEYLLYQTLVGTWPLSGMGPEEHAAYVARIQEYMQKALHEAKLHSSWINPNLAYDKAVGDFIDKALNPSKDNFFLEDFRQFQGPIARAGIWNSISQLVLKIAAPGVPDFYQGCDLWNFHLVDPDNRRPVDFMLRKRMLSQLRQAAVDPAELVRRLAGNPCDGAIKLHVTSQGLRFRREHHELFIHGAYVPIAVQGNRSDHVVAFARILGRSTVLAFAGRFFLRLCNSHRQPFGDQAWGNTSIVLPKKLQATTFTDVITGRKIDLEAHGEQRTLSMAKVFSECPAALLFGEGEA